RRRAPPAWRCGIRASIHLEHLGGEAVVRHEVEELAVEPVDKTELALTELRRALRNHVEHRLGVHRRATDDLEHVGGSNLLLTRLFQFVGEPRGICFLAGSEGTTACGFRRIAALQRLEALRFCCFAACFVALSHCLPRGSRQGIVSAQTSTLEGGGHALRGRTSLRQQLDRKTLHAAWHRYS